MGKRRHVVPVSLGGGTELDVMIGRLRVTSNNDGSLFQLTQDEDTITLVAREASSLAMVLLRGTGWQFEDAPEDGSVVIETDDGPTRWGLTQG